MLRYGFTGTRQSSLYMRECVGLLIDRLPERCWIVTGGCIGADAYAARYAWSTGRNVLTILPADRSRVDPDWLEYCHEYREMPEGTSYKDRDRAVVQEGQHGLLAVALFPEAHPRSLRSGTWMTVRLARDAKIPISIAIMGGHVIRGTGPKITFDIITI